MAKWYSNWNIFLITFSRREIAEFLKLKYKNIVEFRMIFNGGLIKWHLILHILFSDFDKILSST